MQLVSSPSPLAGEGRERGRTSQLDPSDKAVGRAQPPHPNPLPQGERESEVPSNKGVTAISTVLALDGLEFPHLRGELRVFLGLGLDCIPAGSPCFKASPSEPCNACGPLPTLVMISLSLGFPGG